MVAETGRIFLRSLNVVVALRESIALSSVIGAYSNEACCVRHQHHTRSLLLDEDKTAGFD